MMYNAAHFTCDILHVARKWSVRKTDLMGHQSSKTTAKLHQPTTNQQNSCKENVTVCKNEINIHTLLYKMSKILLAQVISF